MVYVLHTYGYPNHWELIFLHWVATGSTSSPISFEPGGTRTSITPTFINTVLSLRAVIETWIVTFIYICTLFYIIDKHTKN